LRLELVAVFFQGVRPCDLLHLEPGPGLEARDGTLPH
jgi:hypothetical protein